MIFFKDYIQKGEPFENLLFTDGSGIPMSTNKYEWFTQERELSQLILVDLKFSRFTAKRIRALALSYMSCTAFTALVVHRQKLFFILNTLNINFELVLFINYAIVR